MIKVLLVWAEQAETNRQSIEEAFHRRGCQLALVVGREAALDRISRVPPHAVVMAGTWRNRADWPVRRQPPASHDATPLPSNGAAFPLCFRWLAAADAARLTPDDLHDIDGMALREHGPAWLALHVAETVQAHIWARQIPSLSRRALLGSVLLGVVHDIRNPINNLLAAADWLRKHFHDDPAAAPWLDIFLRNGELLRETMPMLLATARDDAPFAEREGMPIADVDLHRTLELACGYVIKGDIRVRNVRIDRDLALPAPRVRFAAAPLLHLFLNLLLNARQAMADAGGTLTIRSRWIDDAKIAVEIIDDGPGIDPEILDGLFSGYHTTKPGGSGVGLMLCKQVVDACGGTIAAENQPPRGACFRLLLPARSA